METSTLVYLLLPFMVILCIVILLLMKCARQRNIALNISGLGLRISLTTTDAFSKSGIETRKEN
jgi:hypothetical protein